jgi:hypothetical protein
MAFIFSCLVAQHVEFQRVVFFFKYINNLKFMYELTKIDAAYADVAASQLTTFKDLLPILKVVLTAFTENDTPEKQMKAVVRNLNQLFPCEPVKVVVAPTKLSRLAAKAAYSFSFGGTHTITMPNWDGDSRNIFNFLSQVGHQLHTGQRHSYAFDNNIQRGDSDRSADRTKQCDLFAAWILTHIIGAHKAAEEYANTCSYGLLVGYGKATVQQKKQHLRYFGFTSVFMCLGIVGIREALSK